MTTILHVSDTHLGKRQYGSDLRRADFANAFASLCRLPKVIIRGTGDSDSMQAPAVRRSPRWSSLYRNASAVAPRR
ncbi:hypothetical protein D3261_01750 [Halococcus sp. IIIV-5B]|nr:hypothetical protein D3261_01750 [Halococcus sp. IIIV-5B]